MNKDYEDYVFSYQGIQEGDERQQVVPAAAVHGVDWLRLLVSSSVLSSRSLLRGFRFRLSFSSFPGFELRLRRAGVRSTRNSNLRLNLTVPGSDAATISWGCWRTSSSSTCRPTCTPSSNGIWPRAPAASRSSRPTSQPSRSSTRSAKTICPPELRCTLKAFLDRELQELVTSASRCPSTCRPRKTDPAEVR